MSDYDIGHWWEFYGLEYRADKPGNQPVRCPNPSHEDRYPSASLHLDKGVFKCQACGAGGTAIDLIMLQEGVDLREAFRIADEHTEGISPKGRRPVQSEPGRSELGLPVRARPHGRNDRPVQRWAGFGRQ